MHGAKESHSAFQEIVDKSPQLPADVQWHFIGHLQGGDVSGVFGIRLKYGLAVVINCMSPAKETLNPETTPPPKKKNTKQNQTLKKDTLGIRRQQGGHVGQRLPRPCLPREAQPKGWPGWGPGLGSKLSELFCFLLGFRV